MSFQAGEGRQKHILSHTSQNRQPGRAAGVVCWSQACALALFGTLEGPPLCPLQQDRVGVEVSDSTLGPAL